MALSKKTKIGLGITIIILGAAVIYGSIIWYKKAARKDVIKYLNKRFNRAEKDYENYSTRLLLDLIAMLESKGKISSVQYDGQHYGIDENGFITNVKPA